MSDGGSRGRPGRPSLRWILWAVAVLGIVATLVLGFTGFYLEKGCAEAEDTVLCCLDSAYGMLQLFVLEYGPDTPPPSLLHPLQFARFLAPLVLSYAVLLAVASAVLRRYRLLRAASGEHVVVCGLGLTGYTLARRYGKAGARVVAVELDEENDFAGPCRALGIPVVIGNAADEEVLRRAGIRTATALIATCGDESLNTAIALQARATAREEGLDPLACHVHITNPGLLAYLRESVLKPEDPYKAPIEFFNLFDIGAKVMLADPEGLTPDIGSDGAWIVVAGCGYMGRSLLVQIVRRWHEDRRERQQEDGRGGSLPVVVVVDHRASSVVEELQVQYPAMKHSCRLVPLDEDVRSMVFEEERFVRAVEDRLGGPAAGTGAEVSFASVVISLGDDALSLSTALRMHHGLGIRRRNGTTTVVLTRLGGLASLLAGTAAAARIRLFGLLESVATPQVLGESGLVERLARALHDSYLRQQYEGGRKPGDKPALRPWEELPEYFKASNRDQARWVPTRLDELGCGIRPRNDWSAPLFEFPGRDGVDKNATWKELDCLGEKEHERWVAFHEARGWRYGPVRDDEKRIHPLLKPWDELTEDEKDWDRGFFRALPAILASLEFDIFRRQQNTRTEVQQ